MDSAPNAITYRAAGEGDIRHLAQLGAELFRETWSDLYSTDDLNTFLDEVHSVTGVAQDIASGCVFWIAQADDDWIGYCKAGPVHVPIEAPPNAGELRQLYVRRSFHGKGIADQLMSLFYNWATVSKLRHVYVSCWSENHRALAFYRRHGFRKVGNYQFRVGSQLDDEFILQRSNDNDMQWKEPPIVVHP